ncbi:carboxylesterase family protein [Bradyrhizobium sp. UFLA01-814]|uniref:carboxylesterase/lipase family protein n=1 Tax=Bradyrhizobium sp. UFLA01-814 TaxID=3023480 RepID=UPI00398B2DC4
MKIDTGLLSGVSGKNTAIQVYKGIPYAAPPMGDLRWRAPQPAASWQGVRKASAFGKNCMQAEVSPESMRADHEAGKSPYSPVFRNSRQPLSEDCLYLNVWTPAKSTIDRLPVLVWVHGGGFSAGSGAADYIDGEGLASKGLVVVTINYRLGIFGFFAHPELSRQSEHKVSGNYGLLDQIAALEWVQRNISAFGGDPANVTIAGNSAGALSVNYLLSTPLTRGLIARAIAQSGQIFTRSRPGQLQLVREWSAILMLEDAEQLGVKFAEDQTASVAQLRAMSAPDLMKAGAHLDRAYLAPVVDGYVLPDVYTAFAAGAQVDVPTIIGWSSDEANSAIVNSWHITYGLPDMAADFPDTVRKRFGPVADEFIKAFPVTSDADVPNAQSAFLLGQWYAWPSRTWGRLQAKTGKSNIYLYYWDHAPPVSGASKRFGAFHGSEIVYALNNLNMWNLPWGRVDRRLADVMSSYWVNFAKTGNPNGPGLPLWPNFALANEQTMHLGETIGAIPLPNKQQLDFFDTWYARQGLIESFSRCRAMR